MLTKERFAEIGTALHGQFWKRPLAAQMGNTVRMVERWADGSETIPLGVARDLAELCDEHVRKLSVIASTLRGG